MSIHSVLLVGHGFMGANHRQKIEKLPQAKLVGIVDSDPSRKYENASFYQTLRQGLEETNPTIVAICSSSKTHFEMLSEIFEYAKKSGQSPHILMEKPFVANSEQAEKARSFLTEYKGKISGGYLFRQSPVLAKGICSIKENTFTIQKITTLWQKDRMEKGPCRPSEGVHIDEATHPADLVLNYILPQVGVKVEGVTILNASFKRQSEVGQIVDQEKQNQLYQDEPEKLDPVAEVAYTLEVNKIPISGSSSFKKGPQRREIVIETKEGTTFFFQFDVEGSDRLYQINSLNQTILTYDKCDKLALEWETFLTYCETDKSDPKIPTLSDMTLDIQLTEALGSKTLTFPHTFKLKD